MVETVLTQLVLPINLCFFQLVDLQLIIGIYNVNYIPGCLYFSNPLDAAPFVEKLADGGR